MIRDQCFVVETKVTRALTIIGQLPPKCSVHAYRFVDSPHNVKLKGLFPGLVFFAFVHSGWFNLLRIVR